MERRLWIIPKADEVTEQDLADAREHNCPEIANGIPPALEGAVKESDLPCAFEEAPPPAPTVIDWKAKFAACMTQQERLDLIAEFLGWKVPE